MSPRAVLRFFINHRVMYGHQDASSKSMDSDDEGRLKTTVKRLTSMKTRQGSMICLLMTGKKGRFNVSTKDSHHKGCQYHKRGARQYT